MNQKNIQTVADLERQAAAGTTAIKENKLTVFYEQDVAREVLKILAENKTPIFAVKDIFNQVTEWVETQKVTY
ncbi:hypothetical protein [Fictibacillus sp. JL2B1089]|uniref:hypothetical protein n=1 Tax=Fictibacillus sp. JL2B1089 TaxID=3399565 RepID=UPI003A871554